MAKLEIWLKIFVNINYCKLYYCILSIKGASFFQALLRGLNYFWSNYMTVFFQHKDMCETTIVFYFGGGGGGA